jgi:hypothetical protein
MLMANFEHYNPMNVENDNHLDDDHVRNDFLERKKIY